MNCRNIIFDFSARRVVRRNGEKLFEISVRDDAIIWNIPNPRSDFSGIERGFEPASRVFERVGGFAAFRFELLTTRLGERLFSQRRADAS